MNVNFNYGDVENDPCAQLLNSGTEIRSNEDRHIAETESEDFANEEAESLHAKLVMCGDDSGRDDSGWFAQDGSDDSPVTDEELEQLQDEQCDEIREASCDGSLGNAMPYVYDRHEDYNAPENYGS